MRHVRQRGGTGALFVQDPRWPEKFRNSLFMGDWGRGEVGNHAFEKPRKNG